MSTTILWENDAKAMPGKRRSGSARLVAGALLLLGTTTPLAAESRLYVLEPDKAYPPPEAEPGDGSVNALRRNYAAARKSLIFWQETRGPRN